MNNLPFRKPSWFGNLLYEKICYNDDDKLGSPFLSEILYVTALLCFFLTNVFYFLCSAGGVYSMGSGRLCELGPCLVVRFIVIAFGFCFLFFIWLRLKKFKDLVFRLSNLARP